MSWFKQTQTAQVPGRTEEVKAKGAWMTKAKYDQAIWNHRSKPGRYPDPGPIQARRYK